MSEFRPIDSFRSPRFAQVPTFMRLPYHRDPRDLDVALVGIPYDGGTSYRSGARFGPREIRVQSAMIRPWHPVLQVAPFERLRVADYGDIDISPVSIERTYEIIEKEAAEILAARTVPVAVGGDHSISLPLLRAVARHHGPVALVHFDSHPDTWDEYFGSRYFHGTMFRRAVEERLIDPARTIQLGIRGPLYAATDFDFQAAHRMEVIRVETIKERGVPWVAERLQRLKGGKVYCSFDIDVVDPAYAPGTGTPEVGGLTSYEALTLLRGLRG
ncbi:MAG: agmatinase, partial [Candidatus Rokubacteria bacterium]|nr:agmatinase [Candidatus Rokubacteria bacterium]